MIFDLIMAAAGAAAVPPPVIAGQVVFESTSNSWVVPVGVTSICAVAVGCGGDTAGGCLSYKNDIAVTPGETLTIDITTSHSRIVRGGSTVLLRAPANSTSVTGAVGTAFGGGANYTDATLGTVGCGGAGGYAGKGGSCSTVVGGAGNAGTGGAGGAGYHGSTPSAGGGGGGVGLLGMGASGAGGTASSIGGKGGSGGGDAGNILNPGSYGGGGSYSTPSKGGVRIMWGGGRSYPSNAGDV